MSEYVKVCPQCGTHNQEMDNVCANCGHFLGLVRPVQAPQPAPEPPPAESITPEEPPQAKSAQSETPAEPHLYLESLDTGKLFEVRNGNTVGQAHYTSQAEVQLSNIPNLNYVSRQHCRFQYEDGAWMVESLPTALNGASVNGIPLSSGGKGRIRNGDELKMANVPFRVRIAS